LPLEVAPLLPAIGSWHATLAEAFPAVVGKQATSRLLPLNGGEHGRLSHVMEDANFFGLMIFSVSYSCRCSHESWLWCN